MSLSTDPKVKKQLAHLLWIGGATDSGKSTVAGALAEHWNIPVYHFDRADARQSDILARSVPEVSRFIQASLEELRFDYKESLPQRRPLLRILRPRHLHFPVHHKDAKIFR